MDNVDDTFLALVQDLQAEGVGESVAQDPDAAFRRLFDVVYIQLDERVSDFAGRRTRRWDEGDPAVVPQLADGLLNIGQCPVGLISPSLRSATLPSATNRPIF